MARLVWSAVARDDLKALVSYIKTDSPSYAQTFGLHIQQRVEQLRHFPESGRKVPIENLSSGTIDSSIVSMPTSSPL
jgi:plasmid stabilization system protein ParE